MDTQAVLTMLQEAADEFINPRFESLARHEVMEKNPGDLVTVADREAEVAITARLLDAYPDALIVGEEAVAADPSILDRTEHADHWFTVDPVDGTKNFVHGSPDHGVMVAEMRGGDVVRSWMWQPQHGVAYVAEKGAGAFRNGKRIAPRTVGDVAQGVTSRPTRVGESLDGLPPLELSWVCCAVDYPQIASGGADYILYVTTKPWDHAPGALFIRESGGVSAYADGTDYDPRFERTPTPLLVAADPQLHERLRSHL
ncbi:inositol monophosphatase family protein [Dermacoccus abyssi]